MRAFTIGTSIIGFGGRFSSRLKRRISGLFAGLSCSLRRGTTSWRNRRNLPLVSSRLKRRMRGLFARHCCSLRKGTSSRRKCRRNLPLVSRRLRSSLYARHWLRRGTTSRRNGPLVNRRLKRRTSGLFACHCCSLRRTTNWGDRLWVSGSKHRWWL